MTRKLLLKQPTGGIQDDMIRDDDYLIANVPIYGTKDANRHFWTKLESVVDDNSPEGSFIYELFCLSAALSSDHMAATVHVDGLIRICQFGRRRDMDDTISLATCDFEESGTYSFHGHGIESYPGYRLETFETTFHCHGILGAFRFQRDTSSMSIWTCTDLELLFSRIPRFGIERFAHQGETPQHDEKVAIRSSVRANAGRLAWMCRACRPDAMFRTFSLRRRIAESPEQASSLVRDTINTTRVSERYDVPVFGG
jgi:hypothetical protein